MTKKTKPYDNIPTEQEKAKKRKAMHAQRPDLGAVNDKRSKGKKGGASASPTPESPSVEEINARLEETDTEGLVNIAQLSNRYGLDPKKVRAIIRGLGHKAPPVKDPHPSNFGPKKKYEFERGSEELLAIEEALAKQVK